MKIKKLTLFIVPIIFLTIMSCKKDKEENSTNTDGSNYKASGNISLNLDGEFIDFVVNKINIPFDYNCKEEDKNSDCNIEISGESDKHDIGIIIYNWEEGNYPLNSSDSTGVFSFRLFIADKEKENISDLIFGSYTHLFFLKSNWKVVTLKDFNVTEINITTGELIKAGKIGKLEVQFEATDKENRNVSDGNMSISYK